MAIVTINSMRLDTEDAPNPSIEFLQGANMDVTNIRDTLREIEEDPGIVLEEGNPDLGGVILKSGGNLQFSDVETSPLTVTVMQPYVMKFEAGPIPFQTALGNLLGTFIDSPGAVVQINNTSAGLLVQSAEITLIRKLLMNELSTNPSTGVLELLDDDDLTVILTALGFEDFTKLQLYRGQGMEVRERMAAP